MNKWMKICYWFCFSWVAWPGVSTSSCMTPAWWTPQSWALIPSHTHRKPGFASLFFQEGISQTLERLMAPWGHLRQVSVTNAKINHSFFQKREMGSQQPGPKFSFRQSRWIDCLFCLLGINAAALTVDQMTKKTKNRLSPSKPKKENSRETNWKKRIFCLFSLCLLFVLFWYFVAFFFN